MDTNRDELLRQQYRRLVTLSSHSNSDTFNSSNTEALRKLVLLEGLPSDANKLQTPTFGRCSLRGLVWKALLGIGHVDVDEYTRLVKRGPSIDDSRVREDARRTFAKSDDFTTRVPTCKIIRLLNAYVMYHGNQRGIYAQSMSLLAAPFLYIMPEPDAFHCFRTFLDFKVTTYIEKYSGARLACQLLDKCIMKCLPDLHQILKQHDLYAEVYAFPVMSSLGMCVRPVFDTVRLWDILLAFGIHMHIIFTLARLAIRSNDIVKEAKQTGAAPISTRELEQGFGLNAETVLAKGVAISAQLERDLYAQLVAHSSTCSRPRTHPTPDSIAISLTPTLNSMSISSNQSSTTPPSKQNTTTTTTNNAITANNIKIATNSSADTTMHSWSSSFDKHAPPPGRGNQHINDVYRVEVENISVDDVPASSHDDDDGEEPQLPSTNDSFTDTVRSARRGIRTSYNRIQQQNLRLFDKEKG